MKKKLGPVEKFRPLWEGGKSVEQYNIKVGFKIRMFAVQELNTLRQKNPNLFGPKETEDLTKMIMDLKQDKGTISPEDQTCALEDYQMFLQEFFQKVDYEDRHGTVTMKTTSKFRLMASFIDVLASWGPIDEEMIKCKKYCQFKAVDIFKALKKGEVPKRGGPKEQDNQDAGLGNEIDELAKNMGDANLGNHNQNQGGNFQQQMPNNQYGGNNPYGGQQQYNQQVNNNQFNNPYGNPNQNNINQQNNAGFSNPFGNQNNYNNMNNNYNQGMYQQPPQHQPPQHQYPQQYPQQQYQQPQQNKYNPQPQYQNQQGQGGMNKVRKSKVFPSNDKKDPQKRIFKGKYELDAKIPIKYNSVDYFMLVENVRINNEAALREFKRGKASDILNMVLDSLEFLSYIHK
jgi:hypothetical protein